MCLCDVLCVYCCSVCLILVMVVFMRWFSLFVVVMYGGMK